MYYNQLDNVNKVKYLDSISIILSEQEPKC